MRKMNCPDEGQLLLYVEKELTTETDAQIAAHLQTCTRCSREVEEIQQDLEFTLHHMPLPESKTEEQCCGQEQVWKNIKQHVKTSKKEVLGMKIKKMAIAAAVVLALGLVGTIPAVQTAAANLLQVFRVQKVDTLTLNPGDMEQIQSALTQGGNKELRLDNFGTVKTQGKPIETTLASNQLTGLGFTVKLPADIAPEHGQYTLEQTPDMMITPDVAKINELIRSLGSNYLLPESLEGKSFTLNTAKCLIASYDNFVLIQGPSPELQAPPDVDINKVAQAMVALPIWPENVRRQLESVGDWQHTLLIPGENNEKVQIGGQDAVLIKDSNDRALIWQDNGLMYMLEDRSGKNLDLVKIAESLR